jgi:hypothetical protein
MPTLHRAFRNLFDRMTNGMSPQDQVCFIMNSPQHDRPIPLPILPRDSLTPERFLAAVENVLQSNDQFTLDDSINVNVIHVEIPQGSGRKRRDVINLEAYLTKEDCIVQIKNKDNMCCARSIVVAKANTFANPSCSLTP